jgi:uncharacterized membrane protein HdeD (DUF308 family)
MIGGVVVASPSLASHWWTFLIRGIIAIIFGLLAVIFPGAAIVAFVFLFAGYALVDGVLALITATRTSDHRLWLIFEGVVGIGAAAATVLNPAITAFVFAIWIGVWALITGVLEIVLAIRMRNEIKHEWWLILIGALSIILGMILLGNPGLALLTLVWYVAIYAWIAGVAFIAFALQLRSIKEKVLTPAT